MGPKAALDTWRLLDTWLGTARHLAGWGDKRAKTLGHMCHKVLSGAYAGDCSTPGACPTPGAHAGDCSTPGARHLAGWGLLDTWLGTARHLAPTLGTARHLAPTLGGQLYRKPLGQICPKGFITWGLPDTWLEAVPAGTKSGTAVPIPSTRFFQLCQFDTHYRL